MARMEGPLLTSPSGQFALPHTSSPLQCESKSQSPSPRSQGRSEVQQSAPPRHSKSLSSQQSSPELKRWRSLWTVALDGLQLSRPHTRPGLQWWPVSQSPCKVGGGVRADGKNVTASRKPFQQDIEAPDVGVKSPFSFIFRR